MHQFVLQSIAALVGQDPAAGDANAQQPNALALPVLWIVGIGVLFYFMLLRPNQKRERDRKNMLAALKKNDHVVTVGGIKGIVANVKLEEDEVVLRVDETTGTKLRVQLASIARVVTPEGEAAGAAATKE